MFWFQLARFAAHLSAYLEIALAKNMPSTLDGSRAHLSPSQFGASNFVLCRCFSRSDVLISGWLSI